MIIFKCLCASFLWAGSHQVSFSTLSNDKKSYSCKIHQSVLVSTLSAVYTINPNYGNLTISDGNATHLGEITFWFSRKISAFSVSVKALALKANVPLKNLNFRSLTCLSLTKEKQFSKEIQVHVTRKNFRT